MESETPKGSLYMIPTLLGETEPLEVLPLSIKQAIEQIDHFVVENEKSARRFIKKVVPRKSQDSLQISLLNKYTEPGLLPEYLQPCRDGYPVGMLSEAGCPGIADPGGALARLAHHEGIRVIPLVGPSSILLALMGSGLNGQSFAFTGYLPIERMDRKKAIKALEKRSRVENQSQIIMETPYRNNKLFEELLKTLQPETLLCVAADLSLKSEYLVTKPVSQWAATVPDLHKRPAIYIILSENQ